MQCSSCQFQNMPGIRTCGRCGSPLGINDLPIDVHPPRAGAWQKRMRGWLPGGVLRPQHLLPRLRDAGLLLRLVVPGWAHFYQADRERGWLFLAPYLVLLLLALVLLGTILGTICLALAFGVHAAACVSALRLGGVELRQTLRHTAWIVVVLVLLVYLPAGWLLSLFARPAMVGVDSPPFQAGDVVLNSEAPYWFRSPRPGDVVLYHQRASSASFDTALQHGTVRVGQGERIDRILAGPGDEVAFASSGLAVNGEPCRWQPLNPERWPRPLVQTVPGRPPLTETVPSGYYFLLPTTGEPIPDNVPADLWPKLMRQLTLIPAEDIRGRAYLRSYPPQRLKRLF
jgi:signal peptidase I